MATHFSSFSTAIRRLRKIIPYSAFVIAVVISGRIALPASGQVPLPEMETIQGGGVILLYQDVVVSVAQINAIATSTGTVSITVDSATPGGDITDETENSTTYGITTNGTNKKITGALDASYDAGINLYVTLAAPTGATSTGEVLLTTTAQNLVTGIDKVAENTLSITYRTSVAISVAPNGAGQTRTMTFTLTNM